MSEHAAISLFHRNNHDVDFKPTIETLQTQDLPTLAEHVDKIRKKSITMEQERANRRKMTKHVRRMTRNISSGRYIDDDSEDEVGSPRNTKRQKTRRTRRLEGTIDTMKSGLISIESSEWKKLTEEDMSFAQKYNSKVKHDEDPSTIPTPTGVKIRVHNGESNRDTGSEHADQRARRTGTSNKEDNRDDDEDEEEAQPTKRGETKGISFNMHHGALKSPSYK